MPGRRMQTANCKGVEFVEIVELTASETMAWIRDFQPLV